MLSYQESKYIMRKSFSFDIFLKEINIFILLLDDLLILVLRIYKLNKMMNKKLECIKNLKSKLI